MCSRPKSVCLFHQMTISTHCRICELCVLKSNEYTEYSFLQCFLQVVFQSAYFILFFQITTTRQSLLTLISILTTLFNVCAAYPRCSIFYGRPDDKSCHDLLFQTQSTRPSREVGLAFTDLWMHAFVAGGVPRPPSSIPQRWNDMTNALWAGRVELNIYHANGNLHEKFLHCEKLLTDS